MLHELVAANQDELIRRCREKAAKRFDAADDRASVDHGVPLFLAQLIDTLRLEQVTPTRDIGSPEPTPAPTAIGRAAALLGAELLRAGYSIDQVVHEYDDAIADAVTSFTSGRQISISDQDQGLRDRLNAFAIEPRRLVDTAVQSFSAIRTGNVGVSGTIGKLLGHTLNELRTLPERFLSEIDETSQ